MSRVDTAGAGGVVVAFNPFAEARQVYVEYEPWTGWQSWDEGDWGLADDLNRPVPYQCTESREALSNPRNELTRLVFKADLPPLGYRMYRFAPAIAPAPQPATCIAGSDGLENDLLAVGLDPVEIYHGVPVGNRDVARLADLACQFVEDGDTRRSDPQR